jgi:hypothetical protein
VGQLQGREGEVGKCASVRSRAGFRIGGYNAFIPVAEKFGQQILKTSHLHNCGSRFVMTSEPTIPADNGATPLALRLEFERFSQQLIGLARKHLGARLEHKVDTAKAAQPARAGKGCGAC